jgi:tetratricopeptide (TPR) repeat protein
MSQSSAFRFSRFLIVAALLWVPTVGAAQSTSGAVGEEQARAHFRLGRAHYDNGAFEEAATEFEAAYRISQRPALLYNIYLANRDANDTRRAATALRSYLELEKNIENRVQLAARLAAMERNLAEQAAPATGSVTAQPSPAMAEPAATAHESGLPVEPQAAPVAQTPAPVQPQVAVPPTAATENPGGGVPKLAHRPSDATHGSRQPWPIALMVLGGALVAGSVVTGVLALGKRSTLTDADQECKRLGNCDALSAVRFKQLEDTRSSGNTLAVVTDVLLFGGIAAAATGAVLFWLNPGHEDHASASKFRAEASCLPGRCIGQLKLAF